MKLSLYFQTKNEKNQIIYKFRCIGTDSPILSRCLFTNKSRPDYFWSASSTFNLDSRRGGWACSVILLLIFRPQGGIPFFISWDTLGLLRQLLLPISGPSTNDFIARQKRLSSRWVNPPRRTIMCHSFVPCGYPSSSTGPPFWRLFILFIKLFVDRIVRLVFRNNLFHLRDGWHIVVTSGYLH